MLERCLEALARQSVLADEIVVVDNGSSDLTPEVARWWNVVYCREDEPGIPAAASRGYDETSGDIIARLDADSVPPNDWVARIREAFEQHTDIVAVTGPGRFDSLPRPISRALDLSYMEAYFAVFGHLLGRPPLFGSNFAMRRTAWSEARDRVHRHDASVHDDLDLSFAIPRGATVRRDPDLSVSVSSRPFADPIAFVRRVWRGIHTVAVNRT